MSLVSEENTLRPLLEGLTANDFPTGRRRKNNIEEHRNHPQILQLKRLVEDHAAEYKAADKSTERTTLDGQCLRSKTSIITSIVNDVKPEGPDGRYKKSVLMPGTTDVVTWVINETFNDAKLHKKVTNDLNEQIKAIAAAASANDALAEDDRSDDTVNASEEGDKVGNQQEEPEVLVDDSSTDDPNIAHRKKDNLEDQALNVVDTEDDDATPKEEDHGEKEDNDR